jgi:hypothetical protein
MPKLLLFTPCEKIIIDSEGGTLTLVSITHQIRYAAMPGEEVPANAAIPLQWTIVSMWEKEPGDEEIQFEQRFTIIRKDETIVLEQLIPWKFEKEVQRVFLRVVGFPIVTGRLRLILWLRKSGEQWTEMASCPLEVIEATSQPVS